MPTFKTLINFNSSLPATGAMPNASLLIDSSGNLLGTTQAGGKQSQGTVFEVPFSSGAYATTPLVLVNGADFGASSLSSNLVADSDGNLFGTAEQGGPGSAGVVFEIAKTSGGYASSATVLGSFNGANGQFPSAGLYVDGSGNLFGTTRSGGTAGLGTVFEIAKTGSTYASTPTTLVNFDSATGSGLYGSLIADSNGDLFGMTLSGGASNKGTIFEIVKTGGGYATTPTTLVSFNGTNGSCPIGGLVADSSGNLFGMTETGGATNNGTVFELAFDGSTYASAPTTLVSFNNTNGRIPVGNLVIDNAGNLFGVTNSGGPSSNGVVFEISKTGGSYASSPITLATFNGTNGSTPLEGLVADHNGNLFGTTQGGGSGNGGTVFEILDSGYVTCFVAGTRIATPNGDVAVETLVPGQSVMAGAPGLPSQPQPVKWVGVRRIDIDAHPHPEQVAPVRILRDAFADGVPHRDLLLSPDHAVLADGVLICVRQLINGTSIRQEPLSGSVEYFHVELDRHAILQAEGLAAESYLDTGNRGFFANGGAPLVLHPDLGGETDRPTRVAASCAPFVFHAEAVRPVWQRLAARAGRVEQPEAETTEDPDLQVAIGTRLLRPVHRKADTYQFILPPGTTQVRLVSRAASPADSKPWLDDRRRLGVHVARIVLRSGNDVQDIPVDHPSLARGWWDVEGSGAVLRRWTGGDASMTLPAMDAAGLLEIRAFCGGLRYNGEPALRRELEAVVSRAA